MVAQLNAPSALLPGCGVHCVVRVVLDGGREPVVLHDPATHENYGRMTVNGLPDQVVVTGPLRINLSARSLTINGHQTHMASSEWLLLERLASEVGRYVPTRDLCRILVGEIVTLRRDASAVGTTMRRLRNRLGSFGQMIENSRGIGYRLLLVDSFTPEPRGQWSALYPCCQRCGGTEHYHDGGGLCYRCRNRQRRNEVVE